MFTAETHVCRDDRNFDHSPISLDVGGTVYTASRSVLRAGGPDSWLTRVANGNISLPRNGNDMRFIERDSQAFRHILLYLRALYAADSSGLKPSKQPSPTANLPSARDELTILLSECQFYELPDLEAEVAKALKAAPTVTQSITPGGTVSATTVAGVVDDTTDIYSKASRMQLEFQSVYVTISSSNGLQFTEEERRTAMGEVNARTAELQGSGFRVKAMNTGVAQDRKTKDYCMYFHAVLVRNTGKRVPSANGEATSQLPPKASHTHGSSITSTSQSQSQSSHQLSKHRQPTSSTRPSAQHGTSAHAGNKRSSLNGPIDHQHVVRSADSSSLLNDRHATPHAMHHAQRSSTEGARDGSIIPSPSGGTQSTPTAAKSRAERPSTSGSGVPRSTGRTSSVPNGHASQSHHGGRESHGGIDNLASPQSHAPQRSSSTGMHAQRSASTGAALLAREDAGAGFAAGSNAGGGKDMDGALHQSTGATSAHAKSSNSQQVNTSSTIDSMLAAGQQQQAAAPAKQTAASSSATDVEKAHAAALANLGLPYVLDGGPRRHTEVRVFDINTDGPPKGIPREWEEGLLEGRKRPPGTPVSNASAGPQRVQDGGSGRDHSKGVQLGGEARTDDVRMAAQSAAEASVEQAKRRAAAKAKAMSGPRTQPIQHGPPMHQVERGPKSVRHFDLPATTDIMRSKSDLHLYVREAQELSRAPRQSVDLPSAAAAAEAAAVMTDDISSTNPRSRHRFRLPPSIGRVFGAKRDTRRSSSVTVLSTSATSPLAQNAPAF